MDGSGFSYNLMNLISISPILGPLTRLKNRRIIREKNVSIPHIGNILIPINTYLKGCFAQFYYPELDHKIRVGDRVLIISYFGKNARILCWNYSKDLFGKLGWRYVSCNDINYNIKVDGNKYGQSFQKEKQRRK
jgi:hypothetical protein